MKKKNCQAIIAIRLIQACAHSKWLLSKSNQRTEISHQESARLANKAKIYSQQAIGIANVAESFDLKMNPLNITYKLSGVSKVCSNTFKDIGYCSPDAMVMCFIEEVIRKELETYADSKVLDCNIREWFNNWYDKQYLLNHKKRKDKKDDSSSLLTVSKLLS